MSVLLLIAGFVLAVYLGAKRWRAAGPQDKPKGGPEDTPKDSPPKNNEKDKPVEGPKDNSCKHEDHPGQKPAGGETSPFIIKPYLQLGTTHSVNNDGLEVVWHAANEPGVNWTIRVQSLDVKGETIALKIDSVDIPNLPPITPHKQFRAYIGGRSRGERMAYEVLRNDIVVFSATAAMPKPRGARYRVVAVGDIGENSEGQAQVAYQISKQKPDLVVVPGDIAYKRGRFSETVDNFFPIVNNDVASPKTGAPLMRSVCFVATPGNHDYGRPSLADVPNLNTHPDLFAYFVLWSQPLNGPYVGASRNSQVLHGDEARRQAFLQASAGRFPRMASFSYDYADTHWLFLDSNEHMDWTSEDLRQWVRHDLTMTSMRWKFVVYHHPAFTSHTRHNVEQRMRVLSELFQELGVDLIIMGHAHWYERLRPLKFSLKKPSDGNPIGPGGNVEGEFRIDQRFDGLTTTRPHGIVYLVTGGGGAKLHGTNVPNGQLEPFTYKLIADQYSFTVIDVDQTAFTVRQIAADGDELDRFTVTK